MPKPFEDCKKNGGKVRNMKLKGGRYMPICYLDGESFAGEVHKTKE